MDKLKHTLNLGLQATVPIILTIAILVWLVSSIEAFFGFVIKLFLPAEYYYPGMGAVFGILLVFISGVSMNAWVVSKIHAWGEERVKQIPLVKTIYQAIKDVMSFFGNAAMSGQGQTVLVDLPHGRGIGFITRSDLHDLNLRGGPGDEIAVYMPLSCQIGGFTVLIQRSKVTPIDLPAQEAMRFILTAGVSKDKDEQQ